MSKIFLFILSIVFFLCILYNSNSFSLSKKEYNLFSLSENSLTNYPELKSSVSNAIILNINKEELKSLNDLKYPEIELTIPYFQNQNLRLKLTRFDLLTPDAKIVARTSAGNEEVKLNEIAVSYTGKIEGSDEAFVTLTFAENYVNGMICTKYDNILISALKDNIENTSGKFVLYKENDLINKNYLTCGTDENVSAEYIAKMRKAIEEGITESSATDLYVAEIAIEVDRATYLFFGSSMQNTTNYIYSLMSNVSAMYMKEVNVRLIVPYIRIWTTADPYTSTTSSGLLNQFRSEWNANQQSVQRTLAHFISKRPANLGGIAWLSSLCSSPISGTGYGFSNTLGVAAQMPTFSYEVQVVAHELGHNFGSLHTFNCSWVGGPIDTCYTVEGGCYSGPTFPAVGTIMSYCYNNGSVSFVLGFGPQPRAVIRSGAEGASCMYISQRELMVGYPNGAEVYRTGTSTPIYWGTSLTGNVNIELSTNNGSSWQTIQNNVPATSRTYDWTIPSMATSIQAKVRIVSSSNPAIGDTSDAAFKIVLSLNSFDNISPANPSRIFVSSNSSETVPFTWQRSGTDPSIRYSLKIKKVGSPLEYPFGSNNNGADTVATMRKSSLDSLAQFLGTTGDSVRCSWRVWSYNGYDSLASGFYQMTLIRTSVGINTISSIVPDEFNLWNNYPNPFNPSTNIRFDIPKLSFIELKIFDATGKVLNTLVNERLQPGSYEYNFDASNLPSGVYFYALNSNEFSSTKKMILLK